MVMKLQIFLTSAILIWKDVEHNLLVLVPHSIITAFGVQEELVPGG